MDTIDGMKTIVAVVETGSFTAAGDRLNISKALVSKYVGEVEEALGVRLFNRSTRRLAITEAGQNYYDKVVPLLEEYGELLDNVVGENSVPKGLLRISAPVTFGESSLSPLLPELLARYPDLCIDLQLTDRKIDMLQEGIDLVIRIGGVDDSSLIARKINSYKLNICASKAYISNHGGLSCPEDLRHHKVIIDSNFRIGKQWPLLAPDGQSHVVEVTSRIAVNSPRAVKELAVNGAGIGLVPNFVVANELNSGQLVELLPDYHTLEFGVFAIYPHRRYVSKKVRAFVDFLFEKFAIDKQ